MGGKQTGATTARRKPALTGKKAETALALYNSRALPAAQGSLRDESLTLLAPAECIQVCLCLNACRSDRPRLRGVQRAADYG